MLHYNAVNSPTLELLKHLMQVPSLSETRLVGGTSLALQIGHRQSIDIDLFGEIHEDLDYLSSKLSEKFPVSQLQNTKNIKVWLINGIKVDLVNYPYNWLEEYSEFDGIRYAGIIDIAAMKLSAITGRGTKKDFIDVYFLLKSFTLDEMLGYYEKKYPDGSLFLVLKSLLYFVDAEHELQPIMIQPVQWSEVKRVIQDHVENYISNHKS
jgi:hypothetical protein